MQKKLIILSLAFSVLMILGSFSSAVCSKDLSIISKNENITIEVKKYNGRISDSISKELTYDETQELKEMLKKLNKAIENNDIEAIFRYESILKDKEIIDEHYQNFFPFKTFSRKINAAKQSNFFQKLLDGDNLSNSMCYFNAVGNGTLFFTLGIKMIESIENAMKNTSSLIEALVILFALLPFFLIVFLLTHLIPFRILMPASMIIMNKGKISSVGLEGSKSVEVEEQTSVNISWFTGITINIPATENSEQFLFVSGVAAEVKQTET